MNEPIFRAGGDALSRRTFLKSSTAATVAAPFIASRSFAQVSPGETLRVGLVGCGGRGTGAAAQALAGDSNVKLVALGDAFKDRLESSLDTLKKQTDIAEKIEVPESRRFVGFDAYKEVIAASDVVLLATPPHFRPIHLKAAIDANKHVFAGWIACARCEGEGDEALAAGLGPRKSFACSVRISPSAPA